MFSPMSCYSLKSYLSHLKWVNRLCQLFYEVASVGISITICFEMSLTNS